MRPSSSYSIGGNYFPVLFWMLLCCQSDVAPTQAFNIPKLQTSKFTRMSTRLQSSEESLFSSSFQSNNKNNNNDCDDAKNKTLSLSSSHETVIQTISAEEASLLLQNQTMTRGLRISQGTNKQERQRMLNIAGIPSYKTMMLLISTTVLIWLSEPLLSLVDTTSVGRFADNTVLQLASLAPATMLMDNAIYLTYFLSIATTNEIAKGIASKDYSKLQTFSSQVLGLSAILGGIITLTIVAFGKQLLQAFVGASASPVLIGRALQYCQIRGVVTPLAIVNMVSQSLCLATLDTRTPAYAVLAASIVNIIGDFALVPSMGMAGAALATAVATTTSTLILLRRVSNIRSEWNSLSSTSGNATQISQVIDGVPMIAVTMNSNATNNLMDQNYQKPSPLFSIPSSSALWELFLLGGPIFGCIIGKVICYSAMTVRAAKFGVTSMASHNFLLRILLFMATFGDAVGNATQTFLPGVWFHQRQRRKKESQSFRPVRHLMKRLCIVGALMGLLTKLAIGQVVKKFGSMGGVTSSMAALLDNAQPWAGWTLLVYPFVVMLEQSLVATRDLVYLLRSYLFTMVFHFGCLRWLTSSFSELWRTIFLFQVIRVVQFVPRTLQKILFDKNANNSESNEGVGESKT